MGNARRTDVEHDIYEAHGTAEAYIRHKHLHRHQVFVAYVFWGVLAALINWLVYALLVTVIPWGITDVGIANIISYTCGTLFSFVSNKLWVFRSTNWTPSVVFSELWKFGVTRFATGLFEVVGVPTLVALGFNWSIFGIKGLLTKISVSILAGLLNYFFGKRAVFRKRQ